ncbi:uncharacterized protein LOC144110150 isoform X2 [Amblyomma americanum]
MHFSGLAMRSAQWLWLTVFVLAGLCLPAKCFAPYKRDCRKVPVPGLKGGPEEPSNSKDVICNEMTTKELLPTHLKRLLWLVLYSTNWENREAPIYVFKDLIVLFAGQLDSKMATSFKDTLKKVPRPTKMQDCPTSATVVMPPFLIECFSSNGTCYEKMGATFLCLFEKAFDAGMGISRPDICHFLMLITKARSRVDDETALKEALRPLDLSPKLCKD